MKKRSIALIMTVLLAASSLAGCKPEAKTTSEPVQTQGEAQTQSGEQTRKEDDMSARAAKGSGGETGSIIVGINADPGSLSPFAPMSPGGITIRRTLYEFLVDREEFGGDMVGVILKEYEQIDTTTYKVTIYDYIHDTQGNPVTASDVAFSYQTGKECGNYPKLNSVESVTVLDDYTVEFKFTQELAVGELEGLWMECPIITQASYEASPDQMATTPVGTTAYKVTSYTPGSDIVMERCDDYWQTDAAVKPLTSNANAAQIKFQIITESAQMTIALETGSIDMTTGVSNSEVARFKEGGENADSFNTFQYMDNKAAMIYFNCDEGNILQNQALREAICYAIDAQSVLDGAYNGDGAVLKTIGCEKYGDFNDTWLNEDYYEYNLEKAKELIAEANIPEGTTLTLLCANTEDVESISTIIQGFLLQIGLNVQITPYENAMYTSLTYESDAWDILLATQGATDYLVNIWKLGWAAENYNGHTMNFLIDEELQNILHEALTVKGHTSENVNAFHYYIKDNCYAYGLCQTAGYVVADKKVASVVVDSRNCILPGCCTYND